MGYDDFVDSMTTVDAFRQGGLLNSTVRTTTPIGI